MLSLLLGLFLMASPAAHAEQMHTLREDLVRVLTEAKLPRDFIQAEFANSSQANEIEIKCVKAETAYLIVRANPEERVSTFYYGLHKLGFLFPNPRKQISPSAQDIRLRCNQRFIWKPSLKYRGFHLHTQHPNEWVLGFFLDDKVIARDTILWLARNFQNLMQIQMLKGNLELYSVYMQENLALARDLQIRTGLSVSFAMVQQKSFRLLPIWSALTGWRAKHYLEKTTETLLNKFGVDFFTVELGSTEFTPLAYENTMEWLNTLSGFLRQKQKFLMVKVHASTNQQDDDFGNFNFIPSLTSKDVGVLPHTVMFYGLEDDHTPVYGRKNFSDILSFLKLEATVRPTWYYPETSYFIGMDIDVPLFLTDYLRARAHDYKLIVDNEVNGHINFTSGHELGYWLFDWSVALQANSEYLGDEMIALRLIGEDEATWKKILDFQTEYIKKARLLGVLSASNLFDELPLFNPIHERILLRDLRQKETFLNDEVTRLETALKNAPATTDVKDPTLKGWLDVTRARIQHALYVRKALQDRRDKIKTASWLAHAQRTRESALTIINKLVLTQSLYPKKPLFDKFSNPTSYQYGYGWPARTLHFWEREEKIVESGSRNPFFMNIYEPMRLLF